MQRDANLLELIEQNLARPGAWLDFTREILVKSTGVHTVQGLHLAGMVLLGLLGWVAGLLIRRRVRPLAAPSTGEEELSQGLYHSVLASIARYAPILLFFGAVSLYLELLLQQQPEQPYFVLLIDGLLLYLLAVATIRTFLRPVPPAQPFLELPERVAQPPQPAAAGTGPAAVDRQAAAGAGQRGAARSVHVSAGARGVARPGSTQRRMDHMADAAPGALAQALGNQRRAQPGVCLEPGCHVAGLPGTGQARHPRLDRHPDRTGAGLARRRAAG